MINAYGGTFVKIPFSQIADITIYENKGKKTMEEIKRELGCDYIQNAGFFTRKTFEPENHLVIGGKVISNSPGKNGLSAKGNKVEISYDNQVGFPYHASFYPWLVLNGKLQTKFPSDIAGPTQRSVAGITPDSLLLGTFDTPIKLKELPKIMVDLGCISGGNFDGGGSKQRIWLNDVEEASRIVHNFICVWLNKDNTPTKEDDDMNIIQDLIAKGRKNRPGRVNPMQYITVHDTGNAAAGADALSHAKYLKSDAAVKDQVSWHYTVDDIRAVQHIPDNEDAWHAGDGAGSGNRKSIGIEICINADGNLTKATDNAAKLVASLCKKHNIPVNRVVQHNHWSGKNCPKLIRSGKPYSWDTFISKVKKYMENPAETTQKADEPASWAKDAWESAKAQGVLDGTRPTDPVSRQEMAVILDRLGLI